jgi:hypothetical protein
MDQKVLISLQLLWYSKWKAYMDNGSENLDKNPEVSM